MASDIKNAPKTTTQSKQAVWFDDLVAKLRTNELKLNTGTATKEEEYLFAKLMTDRIEDKLDLLSEMVEQYTVEEMVAKYIAQTKRYSESITNHLLSYSRGRIYAWVQIQAKDYAKVSIQLHEIADALNDMHEKTRIEIVLRLSHTDMNIQVPTESYPAHLKLAHGKK